ncbi:MAG: class I SAM-dependent methyltransferase [Candidatus Dormibacter sp.]|uniref:class I SAM-dependent methyltransferase n=1 Tax=Candidatus Dormibacter sp. TaxID=2973982 RepID=UPI003D9B0968
MDAGLRGPSRTALMAAMGRALHRDGPPPHVLDDWMAADLAGEEGRAILASMLANAPADRMHAFQAWSAVRSRFVEDFVESAVVAGISHRALRTGDTRRLSHDQPPNVLDENGRGLLAEVSGTAAKYGEPFISLFRRDQIEQLLVEHGFDSVVHFGAEEAVSRYFGGKDVGVPDVQRLVTAAVAG